MPARLHDKLDTLTRSSSSRYHRRSVSTITNPAVANGVAFKSEAAKATRRRWVEGGTTVRNSLQNDVEVHPRDGLLDKLLESAVIADTSSNMESTTTAGFAAIGRSDVSHARVVRQ